MLRKLRGIFGGDNAGAADFSTTRQAPGPVPTFSIGVQEQDFDELPYARLVAEKYQTEYHERIVRADLVLERELLEQARIV